MEHTFDSSIQEAEAGRSLSLGLQSQLQKSKALLERNPSQKQSFYSEKETIGREN